MYSVLLSKGKKQRRSLSCNQFPLAALCHLLESYLPSNKASQFGTQWEIEMDLLIRIEQYGTYTMFQV